MPPLLDSEFLCLFIAIPRDSMGAWILVGILNQ